MKTFNLNDLIPSTKGINRLEHIVDITLVIEHATKMFQWQETIANILHKDLPKAKDQGHDVTMADASGDGASHGGQEQDDQPDQEPLPHPDALGPGQQEGQHPEATVNYNVMQGNVSLQISKDWSTST